MGRILGQACAPACALALALAACGGGSSAGSAADASSADGAGQADGAGDGAMDATADMAAEVSEDSAADSSPEAGDDGGPESGDDASDATPPLMCTGDMDEPNETQVIATPLAGIDDCDSSGTTLSAVSSGTGDLDWYHYFGTDTVGCTVDPTAQNDTPGLRTCIFIICPTGITTISSCTNGTPDMSPAGTPGCCTTDTTAMTVQLTCGGISTDDSADVYMRVDQPGSNMCIPYDLAYHF